MTNVTRVSGCTATPVPRPDDSPRPSDQVIRITGAVRKPNTACRHPRKNSSLEPPAQSPHGIAAHGDCGRKRAVRQPDARRARAGRDRRKAAPCGRPGLRPCLPRPGSRQAREPCRPDRQADTSMRSGTQSHAGGPRAARGSGASQRGPGSASAERPSALRRLPPRRRRSSLPGGRTGCGGWRRHPRRTLGFPPSRPSPWRDP
jgi:hypothetical protein